MAPPEATIVPIVHDGVVIGAGDPSGLAITDRNGTAADLLPIGRTGRLLIEPRPTGDLTLNRPGHPALEIQVGGWSGRVERVQGGLITGRAHNLRHPGRDAAVIAFDDTGPLAVAVARAAEGGRFVMVLPPRVTGADHPRDITLGLAGSDFLLDGGHVTFLPPSQGAAPALGAVFRPLQELAIRVKISTPNLKEAPMWGDYHFANSLAAAFERIGHQANVDTADMWYAQSASEDVVLAIRGRHRVKVDPSKINIMWVISHPDRIPDDEYADYDHVFVASDIYTAELAARGLPSVSVLHQATDATLFRPDPDRPREPACLFVGNSRKEYRTMVKWCLQKDIPLKLYGGGWDGVLPDGVLSGVSVANADLPDFYGGHLMLLNDHWDSMRENGFLSNRLFDGSGVATPILTDPVAGLADVFGDAISQAGDADSFATILRDCLENPEPYLEKARRAHDIVMAGHTFDHRAAELSVMIDRIAARRRLAA
ncbi:CgeB family protein [Oceaniglobus trochenteri]|uniref:CgeB family protein n=1 Tax=Oceaniglobus trochenteri TaxID=2763260 RepID=UPI001CFFAF41|nr:glycosyltransferase [Oceaniglobus trochenteri]